MQSNLMSSHKAITFFFSTMVSYNDDMPIKVDLLKYVLTIISYDTKSNSIAFLKPHFGRREFFLRHNLFSFLVRIFVTLLVLTTLNFSPQ